MSRPSTNQLLHVALAAGLLATVLVLMPTDTDWWRKALIIIMSVTAGYHLATAINTSPIKLSLWLECLAFPMVMMGVLMLPTGMGWLLLLTGIFWRTVVGRVL